MNVSRNRDGALLDREDLAAAVCLVVVVVAVVMRLKRVTAGAGVQRPLVGGRVGYTTDIEREGIAGIGCPARQAVGSASCPGVVEGEVSVTRRREACQADANNLRPVMHRTTEREASVWRMACVVHFRGYCGIGLVHREELAVALGVSPALSIVAGVVDLVGVFARMQGVRLA